MEEVNVNFFRSSKNLALYNLEQDCVERHEVGDALVYRVEASQEELGLWLDAQTHEVFALTEEQAHELLEHSEQLLLRKERILEKTRVIAQRKILEQYPIWRQINISELQGYTQEEKEVMWSFINTQRGWVDAIETEVNSSLSLVKLDEIEKGVVDYGNN